MSDQKIISEWSSIPARVRDVLERVSEDKRSVRVGREMMSVHETAHHISEAIIVAASMMTAAFGKSGATFDWSWLYPNLAWIERVGYANVPVEPALVIMDGICEQFVNLINANPELLEHEATLFDSPGAETYAKTVREILQQEIDHAEMHLNDVRSLFEKPERHKPV